MNNVFLFTEQEHNSYEQSSTTLIKKARSLVQIQRKIEAFEVLIEACDKVLNDKQKQDERLSEAEYASMNSLFPLYITAITDNTLQVQAYENCVREISQEEQNGSISAFLIRIMLSANMGNLEPLFTEFFDLYSSSSQYQVHPLAHKIIAVIAMRVYEGSIDLSLKETMRKRALHELLTSFALYPCDTTIIEKLIFLTSSRNSGENLLTDEEKVLERKQVSDILFSSLMASEKSPARREDIFLMIEFLLENDDKDNAKKLIQKAKNWYQYSRRLSQYEEILS